MLATLLQWLMLQANHVNILPQTRHTKELYFIAYTLHGILTRRKINLLVLILNHVLRCKNKKRANLSYARTITALLQKSSVKMKFSKLYNVSVKTINIKTIICRNVLRNDGRIYTYVDSQKRTMDDQAPPPHLTSNAPQTQQE